MVLGGSGEMASPVSRKTLRQATDWVADHRQVGGHDGLTPEQLRDGRRRGRYSTLIYELLRGGRWAAEVARRGEQPRPGKKPRVHAILTIRDAIVMRAATAALSDVWRHIPASIVGGRPQGDAGAVVDEVTTFMLAGSGYGFRFDIQSAYATAPCEVAFERLRRLTDRHDLIDLMVAWRRRQGGRFEGLVEGCPQGPLLLAVLLSETAEELEKLGGGVLARLWLDDGIVLARDAETTQKAKGVVERGLAPLGMKIHPSPEKTCAFEWGRAAAPSDWNYLGFRRSGALPVPLSESIAEVVGMPARLYREGKANIIEAAVTSWAAYNLREHTPHLVAKALDDRFRREVLPDFGLIACIPSFVALQNSKSSALRGANAPRAVVTYPGTSGGGKKGIGYGLSFSQGSLGGSSLFDYSTRAARVDRRPGDDGPASGRSTGEAAA